MQFRYALAAAFCLSFLIPTSHGAAPEAPIELAIWARIDGSDYLELRKNEAGELEAAWKHQAWSPPRDNPVFLIARDRRVSDKIALSPQVAWTIQRGEEFTSVPPPAWITQLDTWLKPQNLKSHPLIENEGTVLPHKVLTQILPDEVDLSTVRVLKAGGADAAVVMEQTPAFARIGFADMENGASNYRVVLGFDVKPVITLEIEAKVYASEHLILRPEGLTWRNLIGIHNDEGDAFRSASAISVKIGGQKVFGKEQLEEDQTEVRFDPAVHASLIEKLKRAKFDRARIVRNEFVERRGPVVGLGAPAADDEKPALNVHISDPSYESYDSNYVKSESAFKIRVEIPLE